MYHSRRKRRTITEFEAKLIRSFGFRLSLKRASFWNPESKKVMSFEFVQNSSIETLIKALKDLPSSEWRFYTVSELTDSMKRSVIENLEREADHN